jgi:hypothetical protein
VHLSVQTGVRYRCELTSLAWVLSLATAGNLLAVRSNQTPGYARSLTRVRLFEAACTWHVYCPLACPLMSACHLIYVHGQKKWYSSD